MCVDEKHRHGPAADPTAEVIRPPLPAGADYTVEEKAALYDQARRIFYDERGQLRSLDLKLFGSGHGGPFRAMKSGSDKNG